MGTPFYMRSVFDRKVVMRRTPVYSWKLYRTKFKTKWIQITASGVINTMTIHDVHSMLTHYPYRVSKFPIVTVSHPQLYNHIYGRCKFCVLYLHLGIAPSIYWHKNVLFWL
jgi:hypothetical protein